MAVCVGREARADTINEAAWSPGGPLPQVSDRAPSGGRVLRTVPARKVDPDGIPHRRSLRNSHHDSVFQLGMRTPRLTSIHSELALLN